MYYIKFDGWNGNATIYEFEKKVEIIHGTPDQFVTMHTIRIASGYGSGLYHVKMIGGKFDSFNQLS
ncbi:MAG: hypothetical protein PUH11_00165 [Bacilli bacterium]|nr:hypothetical protein [Bacilli bacterium]